MNTPSTLIAVEGVAIISRPRLLRCSISQSLLTTRRSRQRNTGMSSGYRRRKALIIPVIWAN